MRISTALLACSMVAWLPDCQPTGPQQGSGGGGGATTEDGAYTITHANEALRVATAALDRFRDHGVAVKEGYFHHDENEDSFMMGEHWRNMDLIGANRCELTQPTHLQYLRIDGRRTLIGTGYFCFPSAPGASPPRLFGGDITWHSHGPEFCHRLNGTVWVDSLPVQMQWHARTLPNPLNPVTWEGLCRFQGGVPFEREVSMLHTWNWIAHPHGPFVHENSAIPFLRAGLAVPTREVIDCEQGRAALDTLRLAYLGFPPYGAALGLVKANHSQRVNAGAVIRVAVREGKAALNVMRNGEAHGDRAAYLSGAERGAAALATLHADVMRVFTAEQRRLIEEFLAMRRIHDYRHHGESHR